MAKLRRKTKNSAGLRDHLNNRLRNLRDTLIARDGEVDPIFTEAFRLDRLDSPDDTTVLGYEVRDGLPPRQRYLIDPLARYVLAANGTLLAS